MVNSRNIDDLRPDVAPNAKLWLTECRAKGLDVEISNTVRDNEYQAYLYAQGRTRPGKIVTNGKTTTFHGAGLAIDFYSKSKGWGIIISLSSAGPLQRSMVSPGQGIGLSS